MSTAGVSSKRVICRKKHMQCEGGTVCGKVQDAAGTFLGRSDEMFGDQEVCFVLKIEKISVRLVSTNSSYGDDDRLILSAQREIERRRVVDSWNLRVGAKIIYKSKLIL